MLKLGHILPIWYDMLLKVQHINKLQASVEDSVTIERTVNFNNIFQQKKIKLIPLRII